MVKELISSLMKLDHGKMLVLLDKLVELKNKEEIFNELDEKFSNHILAEEKAIFSFYKNNKKFPVLVEILSQHGELNDLMKDIKRDVSIHNLSQEKIKKLEDLMKKHLILEDKKFYPVLDKEIDDESRIEMYKKVNYIIGNINLG